MATQDGCCSRSNQEIGVVGEAVDAVDMEGLDDATDQVVAGSGFVAYVARSGTGGGR
jgi:hypothetical protein